MKYYIPKSVLVKLGCPAYCKLYIFQDPILSDCFWVSYEYSNLSSEWFQKNEQKTKQIQISLERLYKSCGEYIEDENDPILQCGLKLEIERLQSLGILESDDTIISQEQTWKQEGRCPSCGHLGRYSHCAAVCENPNCSVQWY